VGAPGPEAASVTHGTRSIGRLDQGTLPQVATERTERTLALATIDGDEGVRRQTSRAVHVHPRRLARG
jgi:hypothetical protein